MPKTHFENPFKANLHLFRYPETDDESLQAWDSADELILKELRSLDLEGKEILIINDGFGALACALEGQKLTCYTDSFLSQEALRQNSGGRLSAISSLSLLSGLYDLVLIKIPKNLSFLEDILCHVSAHLAPKSQVIAGCRVKHLPKSAFALLERFIGPTRTSLAEKKSRLVFASPERKPSSSRFPLEVKIEGFDFPFLHHSNLFSREGLDIGTRFFLSHFPRGNFENILDLGCANGVLGIRAKQIFPKAKIWFSDESKMAVESAKLNYQKYFSDSASFHWMHCFQNEAPGFLDLVLCNPPFHQENTLDEGVAEQMFKDAHFSLKPGGMLRVVGNSHLFYPQKLKRLFGKSQVVATHPKFVVIEAVK